MDFLAISGAVNANSYATVEEADAYLSTRPGFDLGAWNTLSEEQKQLRLIFGALVIDSLRFRGKKAVENQALQFPRIMPDNPLYESGGSFNSWGDLLEYAELVDAEVPTVPETVKLSQIEATYQVIHSHLFGIDAFESGDQDLSSLTIDVISMSFKKEDPSAYALFNKADFGATSTIKLLLQKYLYGELRGDLV